MPKGVRQNIVGRRFGRLTVLGSYDTYEEAKAARRKVEVDLRGEYAYADS